MLKFKLKMDGYYIVVPDKVYSWTLLDSYISQYNIENIKLVCANYKEKIPCENGEIYHVELLYDVDCDDKMLICLIKSNGIFGYYVLNGDVPCHINDMDYHESYIRNLLNDTYEDICPSYNGNVISERKKALKLFTHSVIINDRNMR